MCLAHGAEARAFATNPHLAAVGNSGGVRTDLHSDLRLVLLHGVHPLQGHSGSPTIAPQAMFPEVCRNWHCCSARTFVRRYDGPTISTSCCSSTCVRGASGSNYAREVVPAVMIAASLDWAATTIAAALVTAEGVRAAQRRPPASGRGAGAIFARLAKASASAVKWVRHAATLKETGQRSMFHIFELREWCPP